MRSEGHYCFTLVARNSSNISRFKLSPKTKLQISYSDWDTCNPIPIQYTAISLFSLCIALPECTDTRVLSWIGRSDRVSQLPSIWPIQCHSILSPRNSYRLQLAVKNG
jgi:hypothetical protein